MRFKVKKSSASLRSPLNLYNSPADVKIIFVEFTKASNLLNDVFIISEYNTAIDLREEVKTLDRPAKEASRGTVGGRAIASPKE